MIGYLYTITNKNGDSIVINDHSDPKNVIALQEYPRNEVDIKNNEISSDGQHGIVDFFSYYGKRNFTFDGVIIGEDEQSVEQIKRNVQKVFQLPLQPTNANNGYVEIKWTDADAKTWTIEAKIASPIRFTRNLKQTYRLDFLIQLKAEKPFAFTEDEVAISGIRGYSELGGIFLPTLAPITWNGNLIGVEQITNTGSINANCVVVFYGEDQGVITNPRIVNLTTGQVMQLNTTISGSGNFIEVDGANGTIVDQNGSDLSGTISPSSSFLELAIGVNDLIYLSDEDPYLVNYLPTAVFEVKFKEIAL